MPDEMTYAQALRAALRVCLDEDPGVYVAGEDIGVYGGAFGVTDGLLEEYREERIIDTPISEEAILGLAIGSSLCGMTPIVEMQFSDFIMNAMEPLANQAAKLRYMYGSSTNVPIVVRAPGGGGTGAAATHSQSLEAWFAHVPGLKVVLPATPQDAHDLLLAAVRDPNPVYVLEHKLLYNNEGPVTVRDSIAAAPDVIGTAERVREGDDVTIVTYSLTTMRAMEAADRLADRGIGCDVIDLRSVRPLDIDAVIASISRTGHLLVTHEAPTTLGVGAEVIAAIAESSAFEALRAKPRRVCGREVPMPYADVLENAVIPQVEDIEKAAAELVGA